MKNKSKLNTAVSQPELCWKQVYVILPGHPFYGQKTTIIQTGRTDTTEWCLITHPTKEHFHYRIPLRWVDNNPPNILEVSSRKNKEIALSFSSLQKLAIFLNTIMKVSSHCVSNEDCINSFNKNQGEEADNREKKENSVTENLEKYSPATERSSDGKAAVSFVISRK